MTIKTLVKPYLNPALILPLPCTEALRTLLAAATTLPLHPHQIRRSKQWRYPYISVGSKFCRRHACWGLSPKPPDKRPAASIRSHLQK
ncbi:hypothetical protein [Chroococcidiopsis sp.]|uniref:hypothetical protein n=1 Tax=Chroococcidiopsis sp. TaxID=3088168 RepID=UPI003F3F3DA0